jgi:hypothetical protein
MPKFIWKWLAIGIAIILFTSAIAAAKYYKDQAEQNTIGRDEAIRIANHAEQETSIYRNKLGDTVRITKAAELNLSNFKALAETKELGWINKFENLKKDYRNLSSAGTIGSHLDGSSIKNDTVSVPCDSSGMMRAFHYRLKDEWNDIEALVIDTPRLDIRDKTYYVLEWQRSHKFLFKNWRFGHKEWQQEVTNSNHLIKIDSQSVFVIRKKSD